MLTQTLPLYLQDESNPQAHVCGSCEVRRTALFGALDDAALERVHAHIDNADLPPETRLYARGDNRGAVFTVRSGIVRFERVTEAGDRRIVRVAGRGDLIGQEALLQQAYRDDAVACTPVALCRIPVSQVQQLGQTEAPLLQELMHRWQSALDEAATWSAELTAGPARRRLLKLLQLLQRHANAGGEIWLPRRNQIGDMLDMRVETASRLVSQLRREGVLHPTGTHHARLDAAALGQALASAQA